MILFVPAAELYALEWSWDKKEEKEHLGGFTATQMEERSQASQERVERQLLKGKKGTIIYSDPGGTYADWYDENGVVTRIELDQNHDGKVRSDDFSLMTGKFQDKRLSQEKGIGAAQKMGMDLIGEFQNETFWREVYRGELQEESARVARKSALLAEEIRQIEEVILPLANQTERLLLDDLAEFQSSISRIEGKLLHFGIQIVKTEDGKEVVDVPEGLPQRSAIQRFLLERRQLLIQTAKVKELVQAQETYRTQQFQRKRELESELRSLRVQLEELREEEIKTQK